MPRDYHALVPPNSDLPAAASAQGAPQLELESKQMTPVARPAKDWAEEYRKYARAYEVLYAAQQGEA